jgi:carboxyl-terminal processing protease
MKSKTWITVISIFTAVIVLTGVCSAGFVAGWFLGPQSKSQSTGVELPLLQTTSEAGDTDPLFAPFWEAWQIVHDYYVDQPVDDLSLMQGAIRGMIAALGDQHSSYMDPYEYQDATADLSGEYTGIGAWVNTEGEYLTISEPMPNSPALEAGLEPGDLIVKIDGEDMTGVLPELARRKVLGPAGSTVVLTILREGVEEPFDVSVTRASIKVSSAEGKMLEDNIAYVKVRTFGENTDKELRAVLKDLMNNEPGGMILDLRNNGGGSLNTAIAIASEFIPDGVILYEEYGDGTRDVHEALQGGLATEIPLVVLVNEYSASASEVVAGAIQDTDRGALVGTTTYGKGSVQQWIPLSGEQGAVRVTIARWLTPNERLIHEVGLKPDVEVELTEEDFDANLDPQLDAAVEYLLEMVSR